DGRPRRGRVDRLDPGEGGVVRPAATAPSADARDVPAALQRAVSVRARRRRHEDVELDGSRSGVRASRRRRRGGSSARTTPEPSIMNPEPILVLVTGGTFDKEYNELAGTLA